MATLDEIRLQQLLQPFEGLGGIASLNPLAFQYQDQQYLNQDPTQDFYQPNNLSPTQDFYPLDENPTQMFYPPREFVNAPQDYYQPDLTTLRGLDMNRFQGVSDMSQIDETINDEQNQNYIEQVEKSKQGGLEKLIRFIMPGNILSNIKVDPRGPGIRNFYSPEGITSTGSIASGIMKGYNPVSGGFLNMITGGKYGKPTQYGLAGAMQRRIQNILGRKAKQTDASRSKISQLRKLQIEEMRDRSDRGESLGSIGKSTFSGPGMAFEKQNSGTGKGPR